MGRRTTVGSPGLTIPYGTTAQRIAGAGDGALRYNTTLNVLELYSVSQSAWLPVGTLSAKTVTTTYSANSGEQLFVDTNGGGFTITLPGSPATGDVIRFYDLRKTFDSNNLDDTNSNLFENFTEINIIINKLKTVEKEKNSLVSELDQLMSNFEIRKNSLDKKLKNIQKEKEMYDKAINLINSLKNA